MSPPYTLLDDDFVTSRRASGAKRVRTVLGRVASRAARTVDHGALRLMETLFLSGEAPIEEDVSEDLERWRDIYRLEGRDASSLLAPEIPLLRVREVHQRKRGGERLRLRYRTQYEPLDPQIAELYRGYDNNDFGDVVVWRHDDPGRPTILCLHAWCMGTQWFDERVFAAQALYERGFHVVLPTLPFHGTRTPSRAKFGGQMFPSPRLDRTNEAARQAVAEIRSLRRYLEAHGHEGGFGLMGISLGGYLSALMASVWDDWRFVVPIIAPVSFADVIWRHGEDRPRRAEAEEAGVDLAALREIWRMHTPLSYDLALDREDALIVAATGDAVVRPVHGRTLHQHWGEPEMKWIVGSHIAQLRWVAGPRVTRRGKVDFMADVLPFLERYL